MLKEYHSFLSIPVEALNPSKVKRLPIPDFFFQFKYPQTCQSMAKVTTADPDCDPICLTLWNTKIIIVSSKRG